jgi:hypothetical protein
VNQQMPFVMSARTRREDAEKAAKGAAEKAVPDVAVKTDPHAAVKLGRKIFDDGVWLDGSADAERVRRTKFTAAGD